ncbi:MAG: acetyl-CoA C-acetyltransferase [Acidobacteria bacterium]|nr:acetyl-CoA C-acetyltransferase [Acidobacteriota bacterium]MBI3664002.1 acetyl-CoA C-acetyltransferase [Acidobacteriota bacterium]
MLPMDVVILAGARTPMSRYTGAFKDVSALELGASASREAIRRSGVEPAEFEHVVFGNVMQTSGDAIYGARHVGLKTGLKVETPAVTVNRLCGSGMEAIVQGAHRILMNEAKIVLAGGMENMTQAPHVVRGARSGFRLGEGKLEDSLTVALLDTYCGCYMADTAENLATEYSITRRECDEFALRSQQLAEEAFRAGRFSDETVPVEVKTGRKTQLITEDDHRRPETTMESLQALPPAFKKDGIITAGNASGIVDGAAAMVMTHAKVAKERGWKPMGRLVSWAAVGVEPRIMGIGPVPASEAALLRAGLRMKDMDLIEVNEAFAPQYLAVEKALALNRNKVNVNGGAIALGHPLGATGARLVLTLLFELRRRNARYGLATACIGGGQGIAVIVESMQ